jgi:signal transduction histidine kinase
LRLKLEAARASAPRSSKCKTAIDAAVIETENILETFSALLRIAQLEAATRTSGFRKIDLSDLFERVADAYVSVAEESGREIETSIERSVFVWGDKDLLAEMLANLLDNAIAHTPRGARIRVSLSNGDHRAVASVADNGLGIPEIDRERVFRRFYRLERSIGTPGNGLGLSLVAAVADLHGIKLSAEDNAPGLRLTMAFHSSEMRGSDLSQRSQVQ